MKKTSKAAAGILALLMALSAVSCGDSESGSTAKSEESKSEAAVKGRL